MQIEIEDEELELLRDGLRKRELELMEDIKTGKWLNIPQHVYDPKQQFFTNRRLRSKLTDYYSEGVRLRAYVEFGVKPGRGKREPRCNMCGFRLRDGEMKLCSRCDKVNNYQ